MFLGLGLDNEAIIILLYFFIKGVPRKGDWRLTRRRGNKKWDKDKGRVKLKRIKFRL